MIKPILPKEIREKIINLFQSGYSSLEVFDTIFDEAIVHIDSDAQLSRSIAAIKGKVSAPADVKVKKKSATIPPPNVKEFDASKYQDVINSLSTSMHEKEFEQACKEIVIDILENYEHFEGIIDSNIAKDFHNPPFDFLAFKNDLPYLIEFKGSLENFNSPGETQKRRLKEVLNKIEGLNVALIQVKLKKSQYRILYNEEMDLLFDGKPLPIEPIINWIEKNISIYK
jgi:hypothetical protein